MTVTGYLNVFQQEPSDLKRRNRTLSAESESAVSAVSGGAPFASVHRSRWGAGLVPITAFKTGASAEQSVEPSGAVIEADALGCAFK
jgi:hypothetical protein